MADDRSGFETERSTERRLSAILMADVVGFSRLMGRDEEFTVQTLKAYRAVFAAHIAANRGRLVNAPGDSIFAEFPSVVDAVAGAVEIQRELTERNAGLPDDKRMAFRIGINLGDVISEQDAVYGDGVNIAARLESLADPGGICIARNVFDQVKGKLPLDYEYQGEHDVKNIAEPVRVYRVLSLPGAVALGAPSRPAAARRSRGPPWIKVALAAAGVALAVGVAAGGWSLLQRLAPDGGTVSPGTDLPSIAVLPFDNMSGDSGQEYFSDGITETLITTLAKLHGLKVIARNSTFQYKGRSVDVREIGRALGVNHVLEGSVQRAGNRVRVTAQLIDAASGEHLWAEDYDRDFNDVFAVQDEITRNIVNQLNVELVAGEEGRLLWRAGMNPEAYDYALRARSEFLRFTKPTSRRARELYGKAAELDPNWAVPVLMIGWTHYRDAAFGWGDVPAEESWNKLRAMGELALELDPRSAGAHSLLSFYHWIGAGDYDRALRLGELAIELAPGSGAMNALLGSVLNWTGNPRRALELIERAFELNPVPPDWYYNELGHANFLLNRYDRAIEAFKTCVERLPYMIMCHFGLVWAYMASGEEEAGREQAKEILRITPKFEAVEWDAKIVSDPALRKRLKELLVRAGL